MLALGQTPAYHGHAAQTCQLAINDMPNNVRGAIDRPATLRGASPSDDIGLPEKFSVLIDG